MIEVAMIPALAAAAVVVIGVSLLVTSDDGLAMALVVALVPAVLLLVLSSIALVLSLFLRVELPVAAVGALTGTWLWASRGWILSAGSMVVVVVTGHAAGFGPLVIGVAAAALLLDRLLAARAAGNERDERAAAARRREAQLREILSKWAAQRHDDPELDQRLQAAAWRPDAPLEESRATYLAVWEALKADRRTRGDRIWRPHR